MGFNKLFTQMVENNQHEGEEWSFWLQVDGNETALADLQDAIEKAGEEETYDFTGKTIYEHEVDTLISHGNFGYGYMAQHHKVSGIIKVVDEFDVDDLYKGNIDRFFED